MKRFLALVLLAVSLAGCGSDDDALDPYMLEPFDLPDACYHIDVDDEEFEEIRAVTGIESNPGSVNTELLTLGNITPIDNRFAIFECQLDGEEYQVASAALQFEDGFAAGQWVATAQEESNPFTGGTRCIPQAMVFADDDIIGAFATFSSEWHPAVREHAHDAFLNLLEDTGATDYCA